MRFLGSSVSPFNGERLHKRWPGRSRFVVSLDIGCTSTAISVAILNYGQIPHIVEISHWPGQSDHPYEEKVPTVVLYDDRRRVVACGAEALTQQNIRLAESEGWSLVKNFKLRLHPAALVENSGLRLDDLPSGVRLSKVYADFMRYTINCARRYLTSQVGRDIWTSADVEVILAHPNGWGRYEQDFLTRAAMSAGLIEDSDYARSRLYFIEEAEAAARFAVCTTNSIFASELKRGSRFIVCDAGGSTVDMTTYEVQSISPDKMKLTELQLPICLGAGGVHVDNGLYRWLKQRFARSRLNKQDTHDFLFEGMHYFTQKAKRSFVSRINPLEIRVSSRKICYHKLGIEQGHMTLDGSVAQSLFDYCVTQILDKLRAQLQYPGVQHIVLTGGFGESPYLKRRLSAAFPEDQVRIVVANSSNSKAVSTGALQLTICQGDMLVERQPRDFETWATNFYTFTKFLTSAIDIAAVVVPYLAGTGPF